MVSSGVLDDKTLVTVHALVLVRLLNSPLANVGPFFSSLVRLVLARVILLGSRSLPSLLPALGELLKERGLKSGRLQRRELLAGARQNEVARRLANSIGTYGELGELNGNRRSLGLLSVGSTSQHGCRHGGGDSIELHFVERLFGGKPGMELRRSVKKKERVSRCGIK